MKRAIFRGGMLILAALLVLPAAAQGPRMMVRGTARLLEIDQAEVKVHLAGDVAETVMELVFRNDGERAVEGEFMLPLPEGATVSSYALEVNGALREAVAVEKEKARIAYETIKRQMVDPGLVEREAGDIYHTRVFPIPAKGVKRMRIGYVETLKSGPAGALYHLPLAYPGKLAKFRLEIRGAEKLEFQGELPAAFREQAGRGAMDFSAEGASLDGALKVSLPQVVLPRALADGSGNGAPFFMLEDAFPALERRERAAPELIRLMWDASESAGGVDRQPLFALLDAWFKKIGNVKVELVLLRDEPEELAAYEVRGGNWGTLRKTLEKNVTYEGATSLRRLGGK